MKSDRPPQGPAWPLTPLRSVRGSDKAPSRRPIRPVLAADNIPYLPGVIPWWLAGRTGRRPLEGGDRMAHQPIIADAATPKLPPGLHAANGPEPGTRVRVDQFRFAGPLLLSRASVDLIRLFDAQ